MVRRTWRRPLIMPDAWKAASNEAAEATLVKGSGTVSRVARLLLPKAPGAVPTLVGRTQDDFFQAIYKGN